MGLHLDCQVSSLLPQFPYLPSATSQLLPFEKSRTLDHTSKLHRGAGTSSHSLKVQGEDGVPTQGGLWLKSLVLPEGLLGPHLWYEDRGGDQGVWPPLQGVHPCSTLPH